MSSAAGHVADDARGGDPRGAEVIRNRSHQLQKKQEPFGSCFPLPLKEFDIKPCRKISPKRTNLTARS